jgi:hypothetical protein
MNGRIQGSRSKWLGVAFAVTLAIAAPALNGSSAQAATAPQTIVLAGFSSQHYAGFFKVSGDGRMLLAGGMAISMTCTSGATVVAPDAFARVPIHADGRLHAVYSSPTIITNGTTTQVTDTMSATLNRRHSTLTGTWQLAVNYGFADGTSDQCASGPVRFKLTSS